LNDKIEQKSNNLNGLRNKVMFFFFLLFLLLFVEIYTMSAYCTMQYIILIEKEVFWLSEGLSFFPIPNQPDWIPLVALPFEMNFFDKIFYWVFLNTNLLLLINLVVLVITTKTLYQLVTLFLWNQLSNHDSYCMEDREDEQYCTLQIH
jgi:hypothetical protein